MQKFPIYYCKVSLNYTPIPKPTKSNPRGISKDKPIKTSIETIITLKHNEEEPLDNKELLKDLSLKLNMPLNKFIINIIDINKILHLGNTNY
jgi:hypothetical protein